MLTQYDLVIVDLDGVVWRGKEVIEGAVEAVNKLMKTSKVIFATNNSSKSREQYLERLRKIGVHASLENIFTSAYATAVFLEKKNLRKIYVVGEAGLFYELSRKGLLVVNEEQCFTGKVDAVVVGIDRNITYLKLSAAANAIRKGALFVLTNPDTTLPVENRLDPGAGAIAAAVEVASAKKPNYIIGKPSPLFYEIICSEVGKYKKVLVVGDRLDTDVMFAKNIGADSLLVLTGATNMKDLKESSLKPTYVLNSLAQILEA